MYFQIPHSFSDWMCKKQSAVSHNSAESEILSLDGGFTRKMVCPRFSSGIA